MQKPFFPRFYDKKMRQLCELEMLFYRTIASISTRETYPTTFSKEIERHTDDGNREKPTEE